MRVFISADMEGVAGVAYFNQVVGKEGYERACELMTEEVNAVLQGAADAGAEEFIVCDAHWMGANLLLERLDVRAEIVRGDFRRYGMMQGVERDVDAAMFVGYHARAGASPATFPHSFSGRAVLEVRVNKRPFGETALNAAFAGSFGVPVVLVSGDNQVCEEARATIYGVTVVATKRALGDGVTSSLNPRRARDLLRQKTKEAITAKAARPLRVSEPVTLEVDFVRPVQADAASLLPQVERVSARTVRTETETFRDAYCLLQALVMLALSVPRT
ncbi:MAG: aminopeptidase [Planctomycetota bacterium]|nr:MAG: aminopeptidase [Planctomycetota bacterium]